MLVVDCMLLERLCWGVRVCSSERSVGGRRVVLGVDIVVVVVVGSLVGTVVVVVVVEVMFLVRCVWGEMAGSVLVEGWDEGDVESEVGGAEGGGSEQV